ERTTMLGARWIMVTSAAPDSTRSAQMSWAEVEEPTTMHFWPRNEEPEGNSEEWKTNPPARKKRSRPPLTGGQKGKPDIPVASTRCFGFSVIGSPFLETSTCHSPSS